VELHLKRGALREVLRIGGSGDRLSISREGKEEIDAAIVDRGPDSLTLDLDGRRHRVRFWRSGSVLHLHLRGEVVRFELEDPDQDAGPVAEAGSPVLRAPMPGKILEVLVSEGDSVEAGTALIRMEAMKMEIDLDAPVAGVVEAVLVTAGNLVEPDAELLRLDPATGD
jgi:acetyl/propionyl-CoA carboxylase alpha subunit